MPISLERRDHFRSLPTETPERQAELLREMMAEGADADDMRAAFDAVRRHHLFKPWNDASPIQRRWAELTERFGHAYYPAARKVLGLNTRTKDGKVPLERLRERILHLADGVEKPMLRLILPGREAVSQHMETLYAQLGDDALEMVQLARQSDGPRRRPPIKPERGEIVRTSTPQAQQARFERMSEGYESPVVEAGIMPLVATMNAWGVTTSQSCEGHAGAGVPAPWVMFDREHAGRMQRLLDEAGEQDWQIKNGWRLVLRGASEDQNGLAPAELAGLEAQLQRQRASAASLASRIDGFGDRLAPLGQVMEREAGPAAAEADVSPVQLAPLDVAPEHDAAADDQGLGERPAL